MAIVASVTVAGDSRCVDVCTVMTGSAWCAFRDMLESVLCTECTTWTGLQIEVSVQRTIESW